MKKNKGITLIALAITIILLLILAGVTVAELASDNGIIKKAFEAKDKQEEGDQKEQDALEELKSETKDDPTVIGTPYEEILETGGTDITMTASCGVIEIVWVDKDNNVIENPMAPQLMGMEKVAWNGVTPIEKDQINTNEVWYNYSQNRWANAINNGSYFVWIPRYAYKIIYFDTDANKNAYLTDNTRTTGIIGYYTKNGKINKAQNKIIIKAEEEIQSPKTKGYTDYIVHPAFLGVGTENIGGGFGTDSRGITGMWVAKYEMSGETNGIASYPKNVATTDTIKAVSKPGVRAWRDINIANSYENSFNYDRTKESHLIKNSEWGAVSYLVHSKYGRNATEIEINGGGGNYYTGYGNGTTTSYAYNTINGMLASSTGNISGIYDLRGNCYEYVAGFNKAYSGEYFTGTSYLNAKGTHFASTGGNSTKYVTIYENNSSSHSATKISDFKNGKKVSITGDGILEVWKNGTTGWFSDYATFVSSIDPFFVRGRILYPW